MTEEPTPTPSLRLKPRLRPPGAEGSGADAVPVPGEPSGATPPPAVAASDLGATTSADSGPDAAGRNRAKPRLFLDPSEAAPAASAQPEPSVTEGPKPFVPAIVFDPPATSAPSHAGPPSAPPSMPAPAAPAVSERVAPTPVPESVAVAESAKFKLKPKPPAPVPPPPLFVTDPPAAPAVAAPSETAASPTSGTLESSPPPLPPPPAAVPPPSRPVIASKPPPVPHVEIKKDVAIGAPPPPVVLPRKRRRNKGTFVGLAAGLVLLAGAGGFLVWQQFLAAPDAPPAAPVRVATPPPTATPAAQTNPGPTPSATLNAVAAAPAKAIEKARAAAAAQADGARATDEIVAGDERPAPSPIPARSGKAPAPTTTTAAREIAPGVSATAQIQGAPDASPAFRTYVANLRVSGVVGGASAKALINGRLVRAGEVIEGGLGVEFTGVEGKQLVFKDRSGATVMRRY